MVHQSAALFRPTRYWRTPPYDLYDLVSLNFQELLQLVVIRAKIIFPL